MLGTEKISLYKDTYIHIQYSPSDNWIEVDWIGFQNFDTVKKGCLVMLDMLAKHQCTKVLNDNTHVKGTWSEAAEWGATEWVPAMKAAGLKRFAWIYSPSTFSRLSVDKTISLTDGTVFHTFYNREDAVKWLRSAG